MQETEEEMRTKVCTSSLQKIVNGTRTSLNYLQ
jgi:hypothetical protein